MGKVIPFDVDECRAACCADATTPERRKRLEKAKREWLKSGLSVVYGTREEWETKYKPTMLSDCGHAQLEAGA